MKNKKILMIIVAIILILGMIFAYWLYQNSEKNMDYKFENDKLYITVNSKEWIEVPFDFSYTINYLNETNSGKYKEGTYQLDNKKIVFYIEGANDLIEPQTYDVLGNVVLTFPQYSGKYVMGIVYSDDKGKTWKSAAIGSSDYREMITSIKFENNKNGKMTLKSKQNIGSYNYITQDGGETWLTQDDAEKELTDVLSHYKGNLDNIPKKITPTEASERGYFVYDFVGGKVYNEDILRRFVKNTEKNAENRIADEIIIVVYNINGDPSIYNLGYKYRENLGYVLAKDCTRIDISQIEMADENGYVNAPDEFYEVVINTDIPGEHYGVTIKDSGFSSEIISLTSYSEDYKDIEIARYMSNNSQ